MSEDSRLTLMAAVIKRVRDGRSAASPEVIAEQLLHVADPLDVYRRGRVGLKPGDSRGVEIDARALLLACRGDSTVPDRALDDAPPEA